jgi:hypothetical protein
MDTDKKVKERDCVQSASRNTLEHTVRCDRVCDHSRAPQISV